MGLCRKALSLPEGVEGWRFSFLCLGVETSVGFAGLLVLEPEKLVEICCFDKTELTEVDFDLLLTVGFS